MEEEHPSTHVVEDGGVVDFGLFISETCNVLSLNSSCPVPIMKTHVVGICNK